MFGVSLATIGRCVKRRREAGEVASRRSPGRPPTIGTEEQRRTLWAQLKTHPEAAVEEHCGLREHNRGARVSVATMSRAIRRLGWTYKQRRCRQPNGTSGPEALGAGGRAYSTPESSSSSMSAPPTSAWAAQGQGTEGREGLRQGSEEPRQEHRAAGEHGAFGHGGMHGALEAPTTKAVFEAYVEQVLAPSPSPGQVTVLDNLAAHKGERGRKLVETRGRRLLFLPSCSPDFDPIEEAFGKIKVLLRRAEARTGDALVETIGRALAAVSEQDARGFFARCGYPLSASLCEKR